eukprot:TRINITY_DN828_c0_g1_i5.p1 TRINITY_DN828_c0_g1~~TRINITY_DN828_c0_g1_i5.p1  ORF type:complete len:184 (-),score=20.97 TRINITY_DN828_c0_g1_i5:42-593(-)
MRTLILVAILSIVLVYTQRAPVLSDNFVALVDALIDGRVVDRVQVWEDYDDQKTRFDFDREAVHVHRYNFYKLLKSYEVDERTQNCTVTPLTTTLKPFFGWAVNATLDKNVCYSNVERGRIGKLWTDSTATETRELCVDETDETKPLWTERINSRDTNYLLFHAFIPGVPKPEVFDLPPVCTK